MAGKAISIEIGYSLTRVCEVDYKAKTHKVYRYFMIPTPEGVINDGVLTPSPEYVDLLKSALAGSKMKSKQVVFTITSGRIASREVMIPFVKENRIADVVNANASDYFPVDLSQYQLAYNILGTVGEEKKAQQYKLLVLAAPFALLDKYYELARALKLEVAAIDYAGNSVFQVAKDKCSKGTNLVIKIDERSSLVMAIKNGTFSFTRNVAYGVDEAIDTVIESGRWKECTNVREAVDTMSFNDCTMTEEVKAALDPLTGGIARVVDYYVSHNTDAQVEKIYITGLGADIKGLAEMLGRELNLEVEVLRQVPNWNLDKSFRTQFHGAYVACAGAAAAPLGFKRETEKGKGKGKEKGGSQGGLNPTPIAITLLVMGIISSAVLIAFSMLRYMDVQKENLELRTQNGDLEEIIPIYNEYVATRAEYMKVQAMYDATESRNENLYEFLEELEQKLPTTVNVKSLVSDLSTVTINMDVTTKDEAAAVVEQMRTFNSLISSSVSVASVMTEEDEESGKITVNFTVTGLYWPTEVDVDALEAAENAETE